MANILIKMASYKKLNLFNKTVMVFNIAFAILLMLCYLAPVIKPQVFWPIALLALGYQILLLLNILFTIYWICLFKPYLLISTFSVLIGWGMLADTVGLHFKSSTTPLSPRNGNIRLMTYNVHNFTTIDSPANAPAYASILNVIKEQRPDILALQEFYLNSKRFKICDTLQKVMGSGHYYFEPFTKTIYDSTGIAIFSKYPIIKYKILPINQDEDGGQCIYVDVTIKGRVVRVYSAHLRSIKLSPDDYKDISTLTHLKALKLSRIMQILKKIKFAGEMRADEADAFHKAASACPYPYIIAGDLNDTPSSYTYGKISSGLKKAFREKGSGLIQTHRGSFTGFQIDHIFASSSFAIMDYHLIKKNITDHYPVCADLSLSDLK